MAILAWPTNLVGNRIRSKLGRENIPDPSLVRFVLANTQEHLGNFFLCSMVFSAADCN